MSKENESGQTPEWTAQYDLDEKCAGRGSYLCWKFANDTGCERCYVGTLKSEHSKKSACERWDETMRLIPPDVNELSDSDTCWFCAEQPGEPADGFAVLEMANPEPYAEKGMFFGFGKKVRTPVGSLITLNIAIGKRCRHVFRMVDVIQVVCLLAFLGAAIAMLVIPQIAQPMANVFVLLPVVFLVLMAIGGYYLGRNLSFWYMKKMASEVNFDLAKIPVIRQMRHRDWYFFQLNHGLPRMNFQKTRTQADLFPPGVCSEEGSEE